MPQGNVTVVVGPHWGDEGKGKIVDILADNHDVIVRYQGGANAGHTVVLDNGKKIVFHLLPSGVLKAGKENVLGNGMVIDPAALLDEMKLLAAEGVSYNLHISDRSHVILPHYIALDKFHSKEIGTTGRGIGFAYTSKAARIGIRFCDMKHPDEFLAKLKKNIGWWKHDLDDAGIKVDVDQIAEKYLSLFKDIAPYVEDTVYFLDDRLENGDDILLEGAQGGLLDVDFGTYPYVTSSSTTAGGACTGSGIPPTAITNVLSIIKAYTTRVGEGPFPTELGEYEVAKKELRLSDEAAKTEQRLLLEKINAGKASDQELGQYIRNVGGEYGATTGRVRRCGWLDLLAAIYTAKINGTTSVVLTKVDPLDDINTIKVCKSYTYNDDSIHRFHADASELSKCKPIYAEVAGWSGTKDVMSYEDLHPNLQEYVEMIEKNLEVPVSIISTGAKRKSTIIRYPKLVGLAE